jgi:SAM-dependent methyltransferase
VRPVSDGESMREFWDERAREDALYFVDNRIGYRDPAAEARFWEGGPGDLDAVLEAVGVVVESRDHVVEIGCGVGRLTRVLAARAASVVAVDISEAMLERAKAANAALDNVEWVLGDGRSLAGVADASADVCFSHVVFQHIPDPAITLGYVREMGRVLRADGVSAFQISNNPDIHLARGQQSLRDRLRALLGRGPKGQTHPAWLGSAVDLKDLHAVAVTAGMTVEEVVGAGTQYCVVKTRKARGTG